MSCTLFPYVSEASYRLEAGGAERRADGREGKKETEIEIFVSVAILMSVRTGKKNQQTNPEEEHPIIQIIMVAECNESVAYSGAFVSLK